MAQAHDDWLSTLGVDIGGTACTGTMNAVPGGANLGVKWEKKVNGVPRNFLVGPVPCFVKPSARIAVEGLVEGVKTGDRWTVLGSVTAVAAGTLDMGPGAASKAFMFGAVGVIELSANVPLAIGYDGTQPEGKRFVFPQSLDVVIRGSGKVAIKAEHEDVGSFALTLVARTWELYVVTLAGWNGRGFDVMTVRDGKDMVLLKAALARPGPVVSDLVERHASEDTRAQAVAAATWAAESRGAGGIADGTGAVLDGIGAATGTDPGRAVVDAVAYLTDQDADASRQVQERVEREAAIGNQTGAAFWAEMGRLGLAPGGALATWRTAAEWNAVLDLLDQDRARMAAGQAPSAAWQAAAAKLAATAAARRKARQVQETADRQQAQAAAEKKAFAAMEAARLAAMGPANVINNRTQADPRQPARRYFEKGWPLYAAAETLRARAQAAQGAARVALAEQAGTQYARAQAVFKAGVPLLPPRTAAATL